jgi:heat shock protein HspQ
MWELDIPYPVPEQAANNTPNRSYYAVGQIIRHKLFGYRGVIRGFDVRPLLDVANWVRIASTII